MAAGTFTVAGHRVRTSSNRRYVCWTVDRESGKVTGIMGRSDSIEAIRTKIRRSPYGGRWYVVLIDTSTGEEVRSY